MLTSSACRPLLLSTTPNLTAWPSCNDLCPRPRIDLKCTNTSSPLSRVTKPNPLLTLNHFTVPISLKSSSDSSINAFAMYKALMNARNVMQAQIAYDAGLNKSAGMLALGNIAFTAMIAMKGVNSAKKALMPIRIRVVLIFIIYL